MPVVEHLTPHEPRVEQRSVDRHEAAACPIHIEPPIQIAVRRLPKERSQGIGGRPLRHVDQARTKEIAPVLPTLLECVNSGKNP